MSFSVIPIQKVQQICEQENAQIIDLRGQEDYVKSHMKGAISVPYEEWEDKMSHFARTSLIFYCKRGNQSMLVAKEMSQRGYRAMSIAGGYQSYVVWKKKGST